MILIPFCVELNSYNQQQQCSYLVNFWKEQTMGKASSITIQLFWVVTLVETFNIFCISLNAEESQFEWF